MEKIRPNRPGGGRTLLHLRNHRPKPRQRHCPEIRKNRRLSLRLSRWNRRMAEDGAPGDTTPDHKVREFQKAWARAHPNIAKFWGVALRQAMNAIGSKDHERFTATRIAFQRDERFF